MLFVNNNINKQRKVSCEEMSVLFENKDGLILCHKSLIDKYLETILESNLKIKSIFFNIPRSFKELKKKKCNYNSDETDLIVKRYSQLKSHILELLSSSYVNDDKKILSESAKAAADLFYERSSHSKCMIEKVNGGNESNRALIVTINGKQYIIPSKCRFFCQDILDIHLHIKEKYDFILMDPPWWNKYVKRKRKWNETHGYKMMWDYELTEIPVESILSDTGLIAVWCTNSKQHINTIINQMFTRWDVQYISQWFWLKVALNGEPVTPFAPPNGKQPFERILFGAKKLRAIKNPKDDVLFVSVPSAIHSHKPPLNEVIKPYLPDNPKCLELFARYLLPGWTSYGNEVLKLQDINLFETNGFKK